MSNKEVVKKKPSLGETKARTAGGVWSTFQKAGLVAIPIVATTTILLLQWMISGWHARSSILPSTTTTSDLPAHPNVKILTYDPLMIHISNFLTPSERSYLISLGEPLLEKSTTIDPDTGIQSPSKDRTSSSAFLPNSDPIVSQITARAAEFQGFLDASEIDVQVTSYAASQEYKHHFDWYMEPNVKSNRLSTFFAILKADCEECGTEFPLLNGTGAAGREHGKWCEFIDCGRERLTTKNLEGGALFWVNVDHRGEGQHSLLHAGLPAKGGIKVGLNIWTTVGRRELKTKGLFRPWTHDFDGKIEM